MNPSRAVTGRKARNPTATLPAVATDAVSCHAAVEPASAKTPPVTAAPNSTRDGDSQGGSRSSTPDLVALSTRLPDLEVVRLLGRGGMGAVYEARQMPLNRRVALKILSADLGYDPAFARRFAREAVALAKLNHPHIVTVFDSGPAPAHDDATETHAGKLCYLVMEYVDGSDLRAAMVAGLAPTAALSIVRQICDGLEYAHAHGVVHRDVKPENVLLKADGTVKIADFGLAKMVDPDGDGRDPAETPTVLTRTGQVMGTPRYMAPEQLSGSASIDHRTDIYALGVLFYELLTGELPLGRYAPPSTKAGSDPQFDAVVLRALEVDPARRYQTAGAIKADLIRGTADPVRGAADPPAPRRANVGTNTKNASRITLDESFRGLILTIALCGLAASASLGFLRSVNKVSGARPGRSAPALSNPAVAEPASSEPASLEGVVRGPLIVGSEGDFPTINAALERLKLNYVLDPGGLSDVQVVSLPAGTLTERLEIDGSGFDFPDGVRIVGDSAGTTLAPPGSGPAVRLAGPLSGLTIEGLAVDAAGRAAAVEVTGVQSEVTVKDLTVRNLTGIGLSLNGVSGTDLRFERLTIEPADGAAIGVRVDGAGASGVTLSGASLSGPLRIGVDVAADVRNFVVEGVSIGPGEIGVRLRGGRMRNLVLRRSAFVGLRCGVLFADAPSTDASGGNRGEIVIADIDFGDAREPIALLGEADAIVGGLDAAASVGNTAAEPGEDPLGLFD